MSAPPGCNTFRRFDLVYNLNGGELTVLHELMHFLKILRKRPFAWPLTGKESFKDLDLKVRNGFYLK